MRQRIYEVRWGESVHMTKKHNSCAVSWRDDMVVDVWGRPGQNASLGMGKGEKGRWV